MEPLLVTLVVLCAVWALARAVRVVQPVQARNVERFGRYRRTLQPGLHLVVPLLDRVRPPVDLREQVLSVPTQPVVTEENLVVLIDVVIHLQVTDPRAADYEIGDYRYAVQQVAVTALRDAVGSMDRERASVAHRDLGHRLRTAVSSAAERWGVWVGHVEVTSGEPITSGSGTR